MVNFTKPENETLFHDNFLKIFAYRKKNFFFKSLNLLNKTIPLLLASKNNWYGLNFENKSKLSNRSKRLSFWYFFKTVNKSNSSWMPGGVGWGGATST